MASAIKPHEGKVFYVKNIGPKTGQNVPVELLELDPDEAREKQRTARVITDRYTSGTLITEDTIDVPGYPVTPEVRRQVRENVELLNTFRRIRGKSVSVSIPAGKIEKDQILEELPIGSSLRKPDVEQDI